MITTATLLYRLILRTKHAPLITWHARLLAAHGSTITFHAGRWKLIPAPCATIRPITLDELLVFKARTRKPQTYCLCGSTNRAAHAFQSESFRLTLAGHKVFSIGVNARDADLDITEEQKVWLDVLHLYKIEDADVVRILNVGGSIGESTRRELDYARRLGKRIEFLEQAAAQKGLFA